MRIGRRLGALAAVALLLCTAGCGSGSPLPLSVSCVAHRLSGGMIRARVTVRNRTDTARLAYLYGQPLAFLAYQQPVLSAATVTATVSHQSLTYIGLLVRRVPAHGARRVLLEFTPPRHAHPLDVSDSPAVRAAAWADLANPHCMIRPGGA